MALCTAAICNLHSDNILCNRKVSKYDDSGKFAISAFTYLIKQFKDQL